MAAEALAQLDLVKADEVLSACVAAQPGLFVQVRFSSFPRQEEQKETIGGGGGGGVKY